MATKRKKNKSDRRWLTIPVSDDLLERVKVAAEADNKRPVAAWARNQIERALSPGPNPEAKPARQSNRTAA